MLGFDTPSTHLDKCSENCTHEHQPRENPVPCAHCRRMTFNLVAKCDGCIETHGY